MKQRNRLPRQARWAVPAAIATAIAETSMASTIAAAAAAPQLPSRTPAYVVSGQVRFRSLDSGAALSLAEVPPLIFTEAIRDADLVVRATSIGTDPDWLERGGSRRFGGVYWHRFGFGELGASAKVRREVLHRLLPGLAIADRCRLDGRYLRVRGDVHAYRIHLGSGNVLMSPSDRHLHIPAARHPAAAQVFLPFDDDQVLSAILSKAFLLAADAKITDPSITRQIAGKTR